MTDCGSHISVNTLRQERRGESSAVVHLVAAGEESAANYFAQVPGKGNSRHPPLPRTALRERDDEIPFLKEKEKYGGGAPCFYPAKGHPRREPRRKKSDSEE